MYKLEDLQKAVGDVKTKKLSIGKAAKTYSVPKTTIFDYYYPMKIGLCAMHVKGGLMKNVQMDSQHRRGINAIYAVIQMLVRNYPTLVG